MTKVEQISIFLASPDDVARERAHLHEVIKDLNVTMAQSRGAYLRLVTWDSDTWPGYGADAQATINQQIASMSDHSIFVGIMWNRLGTPTPRAPSGTVEEFERAVDALNHHRRPEIWFYFRNAASSLDTLEAVDQRGGVIDFQKRVKLNGLPRSYTSPAHFRELIRSHLALWLSKRDKIALPVAPAAMVTPSPAASHDQMRINGYKLCYFRWSHKLTFTALSRKSGVDRSTLRRLEKVNQQRGMLDTICFQPCSRGVLDNLEEILGCRGKLAAGASDDFLTHYMLFYDMYKGKRLSGRRGENQLDLRFKTKAVVFDFDGTLTKPSDLRTTWEKIWVTLDYKIDDCAKLHRSFQRQEFDHQRWCELTRDKFRARQLTKQRLLDVARAIPLVDGAAATIQDLRKSGIALYVLSGSIKSVIREVLGPLWEQFEHVSANEIIFDSTEMISEIEGTPYDFEGKPLFMRRFLIEDRKLSPSDILFVGNSCNDIFASRAGVRTLCVNPRFTDPDNESHWTYAINEMHNLSEILQFVKI